MFYYFLIKSDNNSWLIVPLKPSIYLILRINFMLKRVQSLQKKIKITSKMSVLKDNNKWDIYNTIPNYIYFYGIIIKIFKFYQSIYTY